MNLYGLIIGIALIIGIDYFSRHNHSLSSKQQNAFLVGLIISMLIGARTYHVIDNWTYYSQNPWLIPQTWNGGLGIYGALIAGGIFIFLYSLISKISFISILDSITPILPLCQAIGRIGNFVNKEIPTWWIEASLNIILFFIINSKKLKNYSPTSLYLIGYGLIRFFIEFLRNDTWTINHLKIAQIISIFSILLGLFILKKFRRVRD